jgi:ketosteroid isomerase-like protein
VTTNTARAAILERSLRASIEGDSGAVKELYTDDVKAWAPALSASSAAELAAEFDRRDDAFSDIALEVRPLDVGGAFACAEWTVTMTHSGPLTLAEGVVVEPSGLTVTINGTTVAEFEGERICSFRQYWDEFAVLEQLGLLAGPQPPAHN